jgi:hypothetical protein
VIKEKEPTVKKETAKASKASKMSARSMRSESKVVEQKKQSVKPPKIEEK